MAAGPKAIQVDERRVKAGLKRLDGSARDLTRAHKRVAARIAPLIAAATRRRSGKLAAGWKPGATVKAATVRNRVPYAGPQEWGWPIRGITATHAARSVIRDQEGAIMSIYEAEMRDLVERVS